MAVDDAVKWLFPAPGEKWPFISAPDAREVVYQTYLDMNAMCASCKQYVDQAVAKITTGPKGDPGPRGNVWGVGTVDPNQLPPPPGGAIVGDMFLQRGGVVWKYDGGRWVVVMNLTGPAGPPGAASSVPGPPGPAGPMGAGITVRSAVPSVTDLPTTGNQPGDAHLVTATGDLYVWDGTQWVRLGHIQGPEGPAGPAGPPSTTPGPEGPTGPAGPAGPAAPALLTGPGAPAPAAGQDRDMWLDTTNWVLYGPKTGGQWPATGQPLIGPTGPAGSGVTIKGTADASHPLPGAPTTGDMWIVGTTPPANAPAGTNNPGDGLVWDGTKWTNVGPIRGPIGPTGPAGQPGAKGDPGADGHDGADGRTIWSGQTAPSPAVGADGDYYYDLGRHLFFGPKAGGQWPQPGLDIVGPQGPKGDPGAGLQLRGSVPTVGDLPQHGVKDGDLYYVTGPGDLYLWDGTQWVDVGHLAGPAGPAGAAGPKGDPGVAGPAGPPGPTAVSADANNQARLGTDHLIYVPTATARRYHERVTLTANVPQGINHSLGERWVQVQAFDDQGFEVGVVVELVGADRCRVTSSVTGQYDIVVEA